MAPNFHLIIHNVISIGSAIAIFGMAFFTFLNGTRRVANITFSLMLLTANIFVISHVVGVNINDPNISRFVFMFNLSMFFIGAFYLHAILALVGKDRKRLWMIVFIYISALAFTVIFSIYPDLFFLPSVPKMYFPSYYNPGILNLTRILFLFVIIVPYSIYILYLTYRQSDIDIKRKQYKYMIVTSMVGFSVAFIPNLLVYNIPVDPLWGMPFALIFAIPFTYGAIRYQMFDIRVIAKQAFLYSLAVGLVGGLITLLNYSNDWIKAAYPSFPSWITALISAVLAVTIGMIIWRRLRESDLLKYEFITTITHKFRTPLTYVRWSADNLSKSNLGEFEKEQIDNIKTANIKLVELTNLLAKLPEAENNVYNYSLSRGDISGVVGEIADSLAGPAKAKNIKIVKNINKDIIADFDPDRIKFVTQVFIENAIHYTPNNGLITISTYNDEKNVFCSVKDNGIGISKEGLSLLFSKFYRGNVARLSDTEGIGIGLYIAKEIISKHGGRIWAESAGQNQGSTFYFSLPAVK